MRRFRDRLVGQKVSAGFVLKEFMTRFRVNPIAEKFFGGWLEDRTFWTENDDVRRFREWLDGHYEYAGVYFTTEGYFHSEAQHVEALLLDEDRRSHWAVPVLLYRLKQAREWGEDDIIRYWMRVYAWDWVKSSLVGLDTIERDLAEWLVTRDFNTDARRAYFQTKFKHFVEGETIGEVRPSLT